jgi:hypothetical protein
VRQDSQVERGHTAPSSRSMTVGDAVAARMSAPGSWVVRTPKRYPGEPDRGEWFSAQAGGFRADLVRRLGRWVRSARRP